MQHNETQHDATTTKRKPRGPSTERELTPDVEWVDDRDLARLTPISRVRWQSWRREGEGPPWYRVGSRCLYRLSEVEAWLASRPAGAR